MLTLGGITVASLIGGALLIEVTFSWPGVALRLQQAISQRDYPVVQGVVAVIVVVDVLVAWIDLSLKEERKRNCDPSPVPARCPTVRCGVGKSFWGVLKSQGLIVKRPGLSPVTVGKWRRRYQDRGLAGLQDQQRPGRPRSYDEVMGGLSKIFDSNIRA